MGFDRKRQSKRNLRSILYRLSFCVLLCCFGGGPEGFAQESVKKVTYLPHWIPQAQFAGYYVAQEKGFYQKRGLIMDILDGGPKKSVAKALESGEALFSSHFLSASLKLRESGLSIVNLAQLSQRSALMLIARKSSGINSVSGFQGKKVTVWPDFSAQPRALFRAHGVEPRIMPQGAGINLFLRGGVDGVSAMWYNEYHLLLNSGVEESELLLIFYNQEELNFPEEGIYCLGKTWKEQPDLCRQFVAGTLEGWQYAFEHEEESLDIVMARTEAARTGTNRAHQRWMLARMKDLMKPLTPGLKMGGLDRAAYQHLVTVMKNSGEIKTAPSYEDFYAVILP